MRAGSLHRSRIVNTGRTPDACRHESRWDVPMSAPGQSSGQSSGQAQNLATTATTAGAVEWPAGYTAAACLTFDLDAEAAVLTADISSVNRMSPMSHQAYGPLAGLPRILDLL